MNTEPLNCIVIHGCPSHIEKAMDPETRTYDKHWIPWIKKELTKKGIKTDTPLMSHPWEPEYEVFKKKFEEYPVSENTTLIGRSCGTAFLVRWLGESKQKIKKLILIAPWKIADANNPLKKRFYKFRKAFYEYPIDPTIKERVKEIVYFTSDDEENLGKASLKLFHDVLGGEIIDLPKHGHYTENDMGTTEFPELLKVVVRE